jgi:hypothetical protein
MGTTLAIGVMGWRLYGPPAAQVKSIALEAMGRAENMLRPSDDRAAPATPLPPVTIAPPVAAAPPQLLTAPVDRLGTAPLSEQSDKMPGAAPPTKPAAEAEEPIAREERLNSLLAQLVDLDVQEPQVGRWGASGQLFRCSCRASWGQSPQFSRHFESVAAHPEAAVEQVLDQVVAWRSAERISR